MFWGVIFPICFGIVLVVWFLVDGISEKYQREKRADFFVPVIGARLKFRRWRARRRGYGAEGRFGDRSVCVGTLPFYFFRSKFLLDWVSVRLHRYKTGSWLARSFQYEGRKYVTIDDEVALAGKELDILNTSIDILQSLTEHLVTLCHVADKIDSGEIVQDFLIKK